MLCFEKINLNLSFNYIYFVIGFVLLILYVIYVYKFTLPPVSKFKRVLLIFLRSAAIILLLFIFFEPVITITQKIIQTPTNLFYFDNSKSITIEDKTNRLSTEKNLIEAIKNSTLKGDSKFFSFGSSVKRVSKDSLSLLKFNEPATNFAEIFKDINQSKDNISSITIISDGVITQGSTPIYTAEKLDIPVFTVGIGDSTKRDDVKIKNVLHNDFIYAETPTTILATILNKGYGNQSSVVSLFENNKLIEQKNITLDKSGVNTISFDYNPKTSGEKKLGLKAQNLEGEANYQNNQKIFYINVLSNRTNVLVISGSPSADFTFIKNSLSEDQNLKVNSLVQIAEGNFLESNANQKLDSASVIYLIGFPTNSTADEFYNRLVNKIEKQNTPLFIVLNSDVSISKLERLKSELPFNIQRIENNYISVQPQISPGESTNPLIDGNSISDWNNLPPVNQPFTIMTVNPESKILARVQIGNTQRNNPLIITRNFGSKRSIAIIAKDIWRWKLQTANKSLSLFDRFIINSTRWLNAPEDKKRVKIYTLKKFYSSGEPVEFAAQVYDESFNPVNNAEVKINITGNDEKNMLIMNSVGNGLYEGSFSVNKNGDYSFSGSASLNGKIIGNDNGNFNIGDVDIEFSDPQMNFSFLNLLSEQTRGKYYSPAEINSLIDELNKIDLKSSKEKLLTSEIRLWSDEWLLIIVILLFSIEWFLRKRSGML